MGELKQGSNPHIGAIVWLRGETFKAESETAELWQPKWNENQTVLAAAIHTLDRDAGPLEGTAAGSWSLGIVKQSQGAGCCWVWRDGSRGYEGRDCGGKCLWKKARQPWKQGNSCWITGRGWSHHHSLSPHTPASAAEQQRGWPIKCLMHWTTEQDPTQGAPVSAWHVDLQSRTPARGAPLCDWHVEQQRRTPGKGVF